MTWDWLGSVVGGMKDLNFMHLSMLLCMMTIAGGIFLLNQTLRSVGSSGKFSERSMELIMQTTIRHAELLADVTKHGITSNAEVTKVYMSHRVEVLRLQVRLEELAVEAGRKSAPKLLPAPS